MPGWVSPPQAHSRVSNINFDIWFCFMEGDLYKYPTKKYIKDGKFLDHLGFKSKVFPGPLTDLIAWVGFCTSSPQQGVKYQLWYVIFFMEGGGSLWISHEKYIKDGKVLDHLGLNSKVFPGPLTDLSACLGFAPQAHSRVSNINFDIWFFLWMGGLYKYPIKNILRTAKFLTTWGWRQRYFPGL